jgi:DNA-binding CsgD family transcriptional regulator
VPIRTAPLQGNGGEAEVRLRDAFERSRHPMLLADDQRRWIAGNGAAGELLRTARREIPWHAMDDFTPPAEHAHLELEWSAFLSNGAAEGLYYLHVPGGEALPVEFSAIGHVMPSRHLIIFVVPDGIEGQAGSGDPGRRSAWKAIADARAPAELTDREREIVSLVALGLRSGDIAERLFLSPETIKSHVGNAMEKLGARTRARAVAVALVTGQIRWET